MQFVQLAVLSNLAPFARLPQFSDWPSKLQASLLQWELHSHKLVAHTSAALVDVLDIFNSQPSHLFSLWLIRLAALSVFHLPGDPPLNSTFSINSRLRANADKLTQLPPLAPQTTREALRSTFLTTPTGRPTSSMVDGTIPSPPQTRCTLSSEPVLAPTLRRTWSRSKDSITATIPTARLLRMVSMDPPPLLPSTKPPAMVSDLLSSKSKRHLLLSSFSEHLKHLLFTLKFFGI